MILKDVTELHVGKSCREVLSSGALRPLDRLVGDAQDRVIGLLSLPEVYRRRQCAPFEPEQVALHAAPKDAKPDRVHSRRSELVVRAARRLRRAEGQRARRGRAPRAADARVRLRDAWRDRARAARPLVQGAAGLRIGLDRGLAGDRFMPLSELFEEFVGVTAITKSFSGRLVMAPGRPADASSPRVERVAARARDRDP